MASPAQQQLLQSLDHVSFSNQVSGEPLDLRVSFAATTQTGRRGSYRVAASNTPPRVDNIEDLTRVVNATTADLAIESNIAPMPVTVNVLSANMTKEKEDLHTHLTSANSIAHLYTGILLVNQIVKDGAGGELWNVNESDEAIVALANTSNAAYRAMLGPLMGLYNIKNTTASTYNKTMKRSQIHGKFLEEFLGDYGLLPTQLDVLDGVLTDYVKAVGRIPVTPEEQSTVDQVFRINQVTKTNITGDDRYPIWVLTPQTRLVHLKVNIKTWAHAVQRKAMRKKDGGGQSAKDEDVKVAMDITIVDAVLNVEEFMRHRDKFEDIVQTLTGKDLFSFGELLSSQGVVSRF
ncbi:hypothetical protein Micbo1qcDRAFT_207166 [Microdochium bolleyi]|uniref:Uncharacterized protein n=1 Tax=Microdochium bolleyi TaxID=196109 RepID=A0A136IU05_9PEZI|nr:hypothetical protein Micbo1qcDRAFT_207166 [Microdochium bolleyi]